MPEWMTRGRLLAGLAAALVGLLGYLLGAGRTLYAVLDAPAEVGRLRDSLALVRTELDDAKLGVCELHGIFPSSCNPWGNDEDRRGAR